MRPGTAEWSDADDALFVAEAAGVTLDGWQVAWLRDAMGRRGDARWAAFEAALVVARQNGKGDGLLCRELGEALAQPGVEVMHTAHEQKTADVAFARTEQWIERSARLRRKLRAIRRQRNREAVEFTNGSVIKFMTRTNMGGRGFSGDLLVFDEAMQLGIPPVAALLPILSARPSPQLVYACTPPAPEHDGEQITAVRKRAWSDTPGRLVWHEFGCADGVDLDDHAAWLVANPAAPHRIALDHIQAERDAMDEQSFARERLGVWGASGGKSVIDADVWQALVDRRSRLVVPPVFTVDVPPEQDRAWLGTAGWSGDGRMHVELVPSTSTGEYLSGTAWAPERLAELAEQHKATAVALDPSAPAGALLEDIRKALAERGLETPVELVAGRRMGQACAAFLQGCNEGRIVHVGQPELAVAVDAGRRQSSGDLWKWHRKDTASDIAPLVAVTVAAHVARGRVEEKKRSGGVW